MKKRMAGLALAFAMAGGTLSQAAEERPTVDTLVQSFGGVAKGAYNAGADTLSFTIRPGAVAGPSLKDFTWDDWDTDKNIVGFTDGKIDDLVAKYGTPARILYSLQTEQIELQYNLEDGPEVQSSRGCLVKDLRTRTLGTCAFG